MEALELASQPPQRKAIDGMITWSTHPWVKIIMSYRESIWWMVNFLLPFDLAIWHCHLTLSFDLADWPCHLTLRFDLAEWPCHLTLLLDFVFRLQLLRLSFDLDSFDFASCLNFSTYIECSISYLWLLIFECHFWHRAHLELKDFILYVPDPSFIPINIQIFNNISAMKMHHKKWRNWRKEIYSTRYDNGADVILKWMKSKFKNHSPTIRETDYRTVITRDFFIKKLVNSIFH